MQPHTTQYAIVFGTQPNRVSLSTLWFSRNCEIEQPNQLMRCFWPSNKGSKILDKTEWIEPNLEKPPTS
eukprot:6460659-Amphidinium_carterae.1